MIKTTNIQQNSFVDLDEDLNLLEHLKHNHDFKEVEESDEPMIDVPESYSGEFVQKTFTVCGTTIECPVCLENFSPGEKFLKVWPLSNFLIFLFSRRFHLYF